MRVTWEDEHRRTCKGRVIAFIESNSNWDGGACAVVMKDVTPDDWHTQQGIRFRKVPINRLAVDPPGKL
jgi:hypothetical protein